MSAPDVLFQRRPQPVDIGGHTVHVRSMTLREAMEVDRLSAEGKGVDAATYAVVHCLVSESGAELFNGDADRVSDIPLDVLHTLSDAIRDISTTRKPKELAKN